jgi:hypothetical protein
MSYSHRIWLYGPVGLVLLLALLYCVFWRVEADMLSARLDGLNGGEVVPGLTLSFAEKQVGGFPYRLDVVLSGVTLSSDGDSGTTSWHIDKLALHALTYGRPLYLLEAAGEQVFEQPGAAGEPASRFAMTPAIARASAILREGVLARFDLDLLQVQGRDESEGADAARTFFAGRAQFHLLAHPDGTAEVAARVEQAKIGEGYKPFFGADMPLADLKGRVTQSGALLAAGKAGAGLAQAADAWRAAGGEVQVEALSLDWAGVKTTLTGNIGLNANRRAEGSLNGAFDAAQLLGALTRGGVKLPSTGESKFSLLIEDGAVKLALDSALPGFGR